MNLVFTIKAVFALIFASIALLLIWAYGYPELNELLISGSVIAAFAVGLFFGLFKQKLGLSNKNISVIALFLLIVGVVLILAGKDPGHVFNTKEKIKDQLVLSGSIILAFTVGTVATATSKIRS